MAFVFQYLKRVVSGVHCKDSGTICPFLDACLCPSGGIFAMCAMRCHACSISLLMLLNQLSRVIINHSMIKRSSNHLDMGHELYV